MALEGDCKMARIVQGNVGRTGRGAASAFRQTFNPGLGRSYVRYRTDLMGATAQTAGVDQPMIPIECRGLGVALE
jgi:hypothetical protein